MAHTPQSKALAIIPHVTGTLSVLGSCWILYDVFIRLKRKHSITTYHRILTGMSVYDAICSFSLGLSTWPMPIGTEEAYAAVGNTQSCTAQGFFNQLILGSPVYNLMLAIFYLLLGRYHMTEDDIAKKYEIYMHATATIPVIGVAIAGLPLTLYNDANLWCWIASYPPGSEGFNGEHGEEECTRGHGSWYYRWIFFYAPLWFVIVVITIIMIILTASIRAEEKRFIELTHVCQAETSQSRNSMHPVDEERSENTMDDQADQMPLPKHPHTDSYNLERSRKLFYQAAFYVGAFYLTWWGPTLNRLIQMATGESYFFLSLVTAIFAPLQGFLNFLIYRHGAIVA